jgi:WD40 repeat protein
LAVASQGVFAPANVSVWELEFGRGIQTLRGLSGQVSKICLSADRREVAALSHNWEIGVWDLASGQLLKIIEAPKGEWADNAALALSPDGERLAFSSLQTAKVWDLRSGAELASWNLPPGFVDVISFSTRGDPLLFRGETLDGKLGPFNNAHPKDHPRVCRIRDLLSHDTATPVAEIRDFNWHVFNAVATADGRRFVVEGLSGSGGRTHLVKCFDAVTGGNLWTITSTRNGGSGGMAADSSGRFIAFQTENSPKAALVDLSSGTVTRTLPWLPTAVSLNADLYAVAAPPSYHYRGCSLFNAAEETPLVTLGIDAATSNSIQFDSDGTRLAWGNTDGTVTICNLREIRQWLGRAGLQW